MTRNIVLDYFKLLLIILIVAIHMQPLFGENDVAGWLISNGIARIAVPFFFIISGYYIHFRLENKRLLKTYILHLLTIYLVWTLIYLPTYIYELEPRSLIAMLVLGYYHLWFIPALIWGILILLVMKKIIRNDNIIIAIAILVLVGGYVLTSMYYDYKVVRNGLFIGFPFITMGYYIRKRNMIDRFRSSFLIPIIALSIIALLLESYTGYQSKLYRDTFLSCMICCPALFMFIMKYSSSRSGSNYVNQLAAGIYFVHIFVIIEFMPSNDIYYIYKYPLTILISVIFSIIVIFLNRYTKILL